MALLGSHIYALSYIIPWTHLDFHDRINQDYLGIALSIICQQILCKVDVFCKIFECSNGVQTLNFVSSYHVTISRTSQKDLYPNISYNMIMCVFDIIYPYWTSLIFLDICRLVYIFIPRGMCSSYKLKNNLASLIQISLNDCVYHICLS
jgi:hypothetical protein